MMKVEKDRERNALIKEHEEEQSRKLLGKDFDKLPKL